MKPSSSPLLDIIIPTFNEEKALPDTLDNLLKQDLSNIGHIFIVDYQSHDHTCDIVCRYQQHLPMLTLLHSHEKGRGAQMNLGAQHSQSPWLVFLHADTLFKDNSFDVLLTQLKQNRCLAGGFRHRFSGRGVGLQAISWLHNWRFSKTQVVYGDQAMFVQRTLFHSLGGFPHKQMEDVLFSEKLVLKTQPLLLNAYVITDSRKFEKIGVFRALTWVLKILIAHEKQHAIPHQAFFEDIR